MFKEFLALQLRVKPFKLPILGTFIKLSLKFFTLIFFTPSHVLSVINESPQGISQSELIKQTKAKATADGVEILALNAFWAFLKTRTGKDFRTETLDTGKRGQKPTIYRPLKNEYTAVEVVEFKE